MFPSFEQIKELHQKLSPSPKVFDLVFIHCQIVLEIAQQIISRKSLSLNSELVEVGCLLHDVGAYHFISREGKSDKENYIKHGILGYSILKNEGFPEELCRIAERHTGAGITKQQIIERKLLLPVRDYIAETLEERLIMYADKFHSKTPKFNTIESYREYLSRFGEESMKSFNELSETFGIPDLAPLAKKYQQPLI